MLQRRLKRRKLGARAALFEDIPRALQIGGALRQLLLIQQVGRACHTPDTVWGCPLA